MSDINIKKSIFVNAPIENVYRYVTDPDTWSQWDPHISDVVTPRGKGGIGTEVEMKYSLFGIHHPTMLEVTEDTFSPEGSTWVAMITGDAKGYFKAAFVPKDDGTEVTMEISQSIPENLLTKVINKALIHKVRENATVNSLENMKAICEAQYVPIL